MYAILFIVVSHPHLFFKKKCLYILFLKAGTSIPFSWSVGTIDPATGNITTVNTMKESANWFFNLGELSVVSPSGVVYVLQDSQGAGMGALFFLLQFRFFLFCLVYLFFFLFSSVQHIIVSCLLINFFFIIFNTFVLLFFFSNMCTSFVIYFFSSFFNCYLFSIFSYCSSGPNCRVLCRSSLVVGGQLISTRSGFVAKHRVLYLFIYI